MAKASAAMIAKLRDYAVEEPSYTVAFAAWELGVSTTSITLANRELLKLGIVHMIEGQSGPNARVYAYRPIPGDRHSPRRRVGRDNSTPRAVAKPVAGTGKPAGPSGKPSRTGGKRVRRQKTKGYS